VRKVVSKSNSKLLISTVQEILVPEQPAAPTAEVTPPPLVTPAPGVVPPPAILESRSLASSDKPGASEARDKAPRID
jgi:hypothetical protein